MLNMLQNNETEASVNLPPFLINHSIFEGDKAMTETSIPEIPQFCKDENCGIYLIKNNENSKVYVGSSCNFKVRKATHLRELAKNIHHSSHLQHSYNKYGKKRFSIGIIEPVDNIENLVEREQYWIDAIHSCNMSYGYNMSPTAGSTFGVIRSEESKRRMSKIMTGREFSEEHKRNISLACKGRKLSKETIVKIAESRKGYRHSEETKRKMGEAHIGRIYPPVSEETKRKISKAQKGKIISDETKAKMSEAQKGNTKALGFKHTEETKEKIRIAKTGDRNPYYGKGRPVIQLTMDGVFIAEYPNAERAATTTGLFPQNIGASCKGRYKHSGGFIWKYKEV